MIEIDTTNPRYSHFAGLSSYQINVALLLADLCIDGAAEAMSRRKIDAENKAAINALCEEIAADRQSFAEWMRNNLNQAQ